METTAAAVALVVDHRAVDHGGRIVVGIDRPAPPVRPVSAHDRVDDHRVRTEHADRPTSIHSLVAVEHAVRDVEIGPIASDPTALAVRRAIALESGSHDDGRRLGPDQVDPASVVPLVADEEAVSDGERRF